MSESSCRATNPSTCRVHGMPTLQTDTRLSKRMAYVLRHNPASANLTLDAAGWVGLAELAKALGVKVEDVTRVSTADDKQRYTLRSNKIRAAQGHSVEVQLALLEKTPPDMLYHGTTWRFLDSIFAKGLVPGKRQTVHLSTNVAIASQVGERHGKPVILKVDARGMAAAGFKFQQADNGVWLTAHVPANYLTLMSD